MATFKHISSKNADYGAAEQYLTFEHDEFTMKPTLDGNGQLVIRDDYRISSLNCGDEDFAIACMRSNLRYGKNQKREDVKSHHSSAVVGNGLGVSGRLCAVQINENSFGQTKLRVVNSSGSIAAIDLGTELAAGGTDLYGIENKKIISKLKEILNLSFTPVIVYNPDAQTIAQIFSSDTNVMLPFMISERRDNPICFSVTHFWLETPI